jgi:hypothetical protein
MSSNIYQDFRQELIDFLRKEIVGPSKDDEILEEHLNPAQRYSAGILFPQITTTNEAKSEVVGDLDTRSRDEEEIGTIEQSTSFFPSAMGISFAIDKSVTELDVTADFAKYLRVEASDYPLISYYYPKMPDIYLTSEVFSQKFDYKDNYLFLKTELSLPERDMILTKFSEDKTLKKALRKISALQNGWKRVPGQSTIRIKLENNSVYPIEHETLKLVVVCKSAGNNRLLCTVSLINNSSTDKNPNDHKLCYFQTGIKVYERTNTLVFEDLGLTEFMSDDKEEQSLKLLYSNKHFFATGHGTSADWVSEGNRAKCVSSESLPSHVVPQVSVDIQDNGKAIDLRMANIAYADKVEVINNIRVLVSAYSGWVEKLKDLSSIPPNLQPVAKEHISLCKEAIGRMNDGIALLETNELAWESFRLANESMLMQRTHTKVQAKKQFAENANSLPEKYDDREFERPASWRAFQLAFLLMGIEASSGKDSKFKDIVDLIWFPTGGGKTEAYLGLTAYTIFYRRMTNDDSKSGGTTVLMRYTLRLLTSQQFQRACTLILACEKIRRIKSNLGSSPISIGMWVGSGSTPNNIKDADYKLNELMRQGDASSNNPFQVLSCPWCGTHMIKKDNHGVNGYLIKSSPSRFVMWCPNRSCDFHTELPIHVVDDDIYRVAPTLLFGTVDKFAMLPWKSDAGKIFGLNKGNAVLSPELIIQDELHLISGSLGTMVGMYESAIDILCSAKGIKPRIIASTATIRRAQDQCRALYAREVRQFPAPGVDSRDSFFAKEAEINSDTPGRMYLGVMPGGKTSTTMQVRLTASCIQAPKFLDYPDEVKDKFWTQVIYCNSIRELGSSKSIIYDDVKEYSTALAERNHKEARLYYDNDVQELTSRVSADLIPDILQRLTIEYPDKKAIDTLLATNMISVGVDIDRLGLMVILGQPKTTSEYIQASSRVGRQHPGLVITLYSPVKSRDRSHYEQFRKYHQSLYRHVEPTSVTPFSAPVRDKALHAVIITLIRHFAGLEKSADLVNFNSNSVKMNEIVELILARVMIVDPAETEATKIEIERILSTITDISDLGSDAIYGPALKREKTALMRYPNHKDFQGKYVTPQSMRNTDVEVTIRLDHSA